MSFYRNNYLRSEHWQTTRSKALAKRQARCRICRKKDPGNDVHHLVYNLYKERSNELVVLCRACHNDVHEVLKRYPKLKKLKTPGEIWTTCRYHINKMRLIRGLPTIYRKRGVKFRPGYGGGKWCCLGPRLFRQARKLLVENRVILREELCWNDRLLKFFYKAPRYPTPMEWLGAAQELDSFKVTWPSGDH